MDMRAQITSWLFIFTCTCFFSVSTVAQVAVIDEIVATVNGAPIMLSEIRNLLAGRGNVASRKELSKGTIGGAALDQAILKRLIDAEASSRHLSVNDAEINNYIEQVKAANNIDQERLLLELKKNHKSFADYKEDLRAEILKSKLAGAFARDTIAIAPHEVDTYLREHSPHPSKIHLIKISLPPEKFDKDIVESVQIKMNEGATIKQIEKELDITDISSDFGLVAEQDLAPEIYSAIKNLQPGDYSEVIQGDSTWDFYGVTERTAAEPYSEAEYEDAREAIRKSKFEQSIVEYFLTELPKKYPVERFS